MSTTMKAVEIRSFGDPDGLAVVDVPVPAPGRGQVLITTEAIGVSGADTLIRSGALAAYGFTEGHIPGGEVAGTVTAVGEDVDSAWVGQRVWASPGTGGGYVEQALAPAGEVLALPAGLSAVDAVALGSSGVVAHFGLSTLESGDAVLVRGASGSIGIMAVQLASRIAGAVAVTTSSAERGDRLRDLGATHVLDRSGEGGGPDGYDLILDVVAGADLPSFLRRLNPNGRLVVVGAVGGQPPADFGTEIMAAFRKSLSFATFSADTVPAAERASVRAAQLTAAANGELRAVVHDVLPLAQAASAHRRMDAGEVFGRIVLTPQPHRARSTAS